MVELHDFIVVGSGAGGATVARELSSAGKRVLLLEGGRSIEPRRAAEAYSALKGDVEIWYTQCLGGTTMVSMGNAVKSPLYPALKEYYRSAESDLGVTPVPESRMGRGTRLLRAAHKGWSVMPKAIDFSICKGCGRCPSGCPTTARWSSLRYVMDAKRNGCEVLTGSPAKRVVIQRGRAVGVELSDGKTFRGGAVVISAGAIETPRILQRSGVEGSGEGLFADTFITVGGLKRGIGMNAELGMALYEKRDGYLLSPHYSSLLVEKLRQRAPEARPSDILAVMVKIEDDPSGSVGQGEVAKGITRRDALLLESGKRAAIDLLTSAGVDAGTIVSTHPRGAHPGGTCHALFSSWHEPIAGVESLHVSDASILAGPFGLPPMLTIIALSKALASALLGKR